MSRRRYRPVQPAEPVSEPVVRVFRPEDVPRIVPKRRPRIGIRMQVPDPESTPEETS